MVPYDQLKTLKKVLIKNNLRLLLFTKKAVNVIIAITFHIKIYHSFIPEEVCCPSPPPDRAWYVYDPHLEIFALSWKNIRTAIADLKTVETDSEILICFVHRVQSYRQVVQSRLR
jgi:hypothetical protein